MSVWEGVYPYTGKCKTDTNIVYYDVLSQIVTYSYILSEIIKQSPKDAQVVASSSRLNWNLRVSVRRRLAYMHVCTHNSTETHGSQFKEDSHMCTHAHMVQVKPTILSSNKIRIHAHMHTQLNWNPWVSVQRRLIYAYTFIYITHFLKSFKR